MKMKEYLWQKYIHYDSWDDPKYNYTFSFDSVSCKTTQEAMVANPAYVVLNIQRC